MTLNPTLSKYFQAGNSRDLEAFLSCFQADATVEDESATHQGLEEIGRWFRDTRSKYEFTAEVLRFVEENGETVVTCRVSGNFPGSPVDLDYNFTMHGDRIARLRIS